MLQRTRVLALALLITLVVLASAPASAGPPTERLRGFFSTVNAVLVDPATERQPLERVARIRRLVADITDIPSAAAVALGPEWAARTPAEREEFTELFAELLERAYVGRLAGAVRVTGVVTLKYVDEVADGETATVTTAVGGTDGHIEYRMTLRGARWQVRDIVLDGVSVVDNYRAQFKRMLQQDSYPAVVTAMRTKLAGESLLFAALPRRTARIVSTPRPESQAVAAAPSAPVAAPPSAPPPPPVEPSAHRAAQQPSCQLLRGQRARPPRCSRSPRRTSRWRRQRAPSRGLPRGPPRHLSGSCSPRFCWRSPASAASHTSVVGN